MSALGPQPGGAPAPPPAPPLLAALGQAGGGPSAPPGGGGSDGAKAEQLLTQIGKLIAQYVQIEPDPEDRAEGSKLLQLVHQIQADRAKEHDDALGMTPQLKFVRRQTQRGGGSSGGGGGGY